MLKAAVALCGQLSLVSSQCQVDNFALVAGDLWEAPCRGSEMLQCPPSPWEASGIQRRGL